MIRETLPAEIARRRYSPEDYDILPPVKDYILETHGGKFNLALFADTLEWLDGQQDKFDEYRADDVRMEEYVATCWSLVAFWKATYDLVDRDELSDEMKKKYERVRITAFRFEADDFVWNAKIAQYKISNRYDYDMYLTTTYDYPGDKLWKIAFESNTHIHPSDYKALLEDLNT